MITTIILDWGSVVAPSFEWPMLEKVFRKYKKHPGKIWDKKKAYFRLLRIGKISEKEYWRRILKTANIPEDPEDIIKLREQYLTVNKNIFAFLKRLSKTYRLIIASNNVKEWADFQKKKFNLEKYFDAFIYSFDLGLAKPDIKFYEAVITLAKINPKEAVFIDDQEENLIPAKKLGMAIIHYTSFEHLKRELGALGVRI